MDSRSLVILLIVVAVIGLAVARRVRAARGSGGRGGLFSRIVKVDLLWITPAIVVAGAAVLIALGPAPGPAAIAVWAAALAVGGGLGWVRGRSLRIEVHPETAEVRSHAGASFLIVVVALIAIRGGARYWLLQHPTALPLSPTELVDAFVVMAVGLVAIQRLEMWLRARRLLAARAAGLADTFS